MTPELLHLSVLLGHFACAWFKRRWSASSVVAVVYYCLPDRLFEFNTSLYFSFPLAVSYFVVILRINRPYYVRQAGSY